MPDDSLPSIAILGAGPIGLETTLYARYLGYPVQLIERGASPAANVLQWGHVTLFTPFSMNASSLGVAALQAQDPNWQIPPADALLTGTEYHQRYLQPLAKSDLISSSLQCETEVISIGRKGWLKSEGVGDEQRGESPFALLLRNSLGEEKLVEADIVIDCTGTFGNHNWLGQGGIPALGEIAAANRIEYGLPDVLGRDKPHYQDKHILVVGAGYSAATTITQLAELAKVTWITRSLAEADPIVRIPNDRLSNRDALAADANHLAAQDGSVTHHSSTYISAVRYRSDTDDFEVTLAGEQVGLNVFDRIVANVGYRPDNRIYSELQIHECYASGGPMKLAAQVLRNASQGAVDCLDQAACGPQSLINPEPGFYILGSKSYGRGSQFLLSVGLEQIRDMFTIIGQREDLDIYATMPTLK